MVLHHVGEILLVFKRLAFNGYQQISADQNRHVAQIGPFRPGAQTRLVAGAARDNFNNQQAWTGRKSKLVG